MLIEYLGDAEDNRTLSAKDLLLDRDNLRLISSLQESMVCGHLVFVEPLSLNFDDS